MGWGFVRGLFWRGAMGLPSLLLLLLLLCVYIQSSR